MTPRDLATAFVRAFCAGDVDALGDLLAADLLFSGPLLRCASRAEYLRALRTDPPEPGARYAVEALVEQGDEVCLVYRYVKSGGSLRIAQWARCRKDRIAELRLLFESESVG